MGVQSLHSVLESTWQGEVQKGLKRAADVVAKAGRSSALATLTLTERIQARDIATLNEEKLVVVHGRESGR